MTRVKVVDASALAAIFFQEPAEAEMTRRLSGADLAAPALLWFELANVAAMKSRRHSDMAAAYAAAFRLRGRFPVRIVEVHHDAVLTLAGQTGLTAYDANYLWLARHMDAELITLDRRLAAAELALR